MTARSSVTDQRCSRLVSARASECVFTDGEEMELCNYANEILSEDGFHFKSVPSSQLHACECEWVNFVFIVPQILGKIS